MLLEKFVQSWQILHNEMAQNTLICLDTHQGGAEVGGWHQVFNDGTHHPEGIFLFQEEKQGSHNLGGGKQRLEKKLQGKYDTESCDFPL